jgi:GMP synthase-like glutamine amidotransferase
MTRIRPVLLVGLWVDEDPAGGWLPKAAGVGEVAVAAGYDLQVIHHTHLDPKPWLAEPPAGIILSGSRLNLGEDCELNDFPALCALLDGLPQVPVLGICFGHQFLAYQAGGRLGFLTERRQTSDWPVSVDKPGPLFAGLLDPCPMGENHRQVVLDPGRDFRVVARSTDGIEAIVHATLPWVGVQFHPEYFPAQAVPHGRTFLDNWFRSLT